MRCSIGEHPARNIVDAGFLELVRLGILAADDPIVVDSIAVVDSVLKRDLPQGPCWRRYNFDGYGQHGDGSAFDGTGIGRVWPLLTGDRGHYELAIGRDATPFIKSMEGFASQGGLLAEQLWDSDDIAENEMFLGKPAGSAMPLCWAHAEYISLVRSVQVGVCFDRIETCYQRYVVGKQGSRLQIWTFAHQPAKLSKGSTLRIICDAPVTVHWSANNWATRQDSTTEPNELGLHFVDLPTGQLSKGAVIVLTFHWSEGSRWEGRDFVILVD